MRSRRTGAFFRIAIASLAWVAGMSPAIAAVAPPPEPAKDVAFWRSVGPGKPWTETKRFSPFGAGAKAGSIAAHDLGSDGVDEILAGSGFGVPPLVRVLRGDGSEILSFAPFDAGMLQGVDVAMGDLNGDGKAEIVAGADPLPPRRLHSRSRGRP